MVSKSDHYSLIFLHFRRAFEHTFRVQIRPIGQFGWIDSTDNTYRTLNYLSIPKMYNHTNTDIWKHQMKAHKGNYGLHLRPRLSYCLLSLLVNEVQYKDWRISFPNDIRQSINRWQNNKKRTISWFASLGTTIRGSQLTYFSFQIYNLHFNCTIFMQK